MRSVARELADGAAGDRRRDPTAPVGFSRASNRRFSVRQSVLEAIEKAANPAQIGFKKVANQ